MNYSASNKEKTRKALIVKCSGDYWYGRCSGKTCVYEVYEPQAGERELITVSGLGTILLSDAYLIPTFVEVAQAIEDGKDLLVFNEKTFRFNICDRISIEFGKIYKIVEDELERCNKLDKSLFEIDSIIDVQNGNIFKVVLWSAYDYIYIVGPLGTIKVSKDKLQNSDKWKVIYKDKV